MSDTQKDYGTRTVIQCNCGQVFNTSTDLFAHMHEADPDATAPMRHNNMTHQQPLTQREHEREQDESETIQRTRLHSW